MLPKLLLYAIKHLYTNSFVFAMLCTVLMLLDNCSAKLVNIVEKMTYESLKTVNRASLLFLSDIYVQGGTRNELVLHKSEGRKYILSI